MVEWLLGDKCNRPYREQQLTAAANGHFFKMYVSLSIVEITPMLFHFFSVVDHVITVKLHLHLPAVLINGILPKF
jgi:hypothetical protein